MDTTGYRKSLLYTIRERQLKFFGHIIRAGGLEKLSWSAKIFGNKREERNVQNKNHRQFKQICIHKEGTNNKLMRKTENREGWRAMIIDICKTRPDI
ncbi:hypothetical protein PoB_000511800 [Plakobranchus ocellatus]|uniref:Uncharacterized protein n=1 Tax=Plakobranchus ocellatus TaxID=259542 RepID=A0AAV3Y856_9GAST|nr:hypothetical protein PoB_000511800 [Plakobranchus ocellatus]